MNNWTLFHPNLIPIIPPGAKLSPRSGLTPDKLGKIPGYLTGAGWVGLHNWTRHQSTPENLADWHEMRAGLGLICRAHVAIDIDITDAALAEAVQALAVKMLGSAPCRTGNPPKRLLLYPVAEPLANKLSVVFENGQAIEVLGAGQQCVVEGVHPKTGKPYEWDQSPAALGPDLFSWEPVPTREMITGFLNAATALAAERGYVVKNATPQEWDEAQGWNESQEEVDPIRLRHTLARVDPNRYPSHPEWAGMLAAIANSGGDAELAIAWSSGELGNWPVPEKYCGDDFDMKTKLASFRGRPVSGKKAGFGSIVHAAKTAPEAQGGPAEPKCVPSTLRRIELPPGVTLERVHAILEKRLGPGRRGLPPGLIEADFEREHQTITLDELIEVLNQTDDVTITPPVEKSKSGRRLILQSGDSVMAKPIEWLWKGYLARGKLALLGGRKNDAKSTIAIDLAARLSNGTPWPDGSPCEIGDTLIYSSEDGFEDTILPRFLAAGGDRRRIHNIAGSTDATGKNRQAFDPARDMQLLEDAIRQVPKCRLLDLDPFAMVIKSDQGNNAGNRRDMAPVVDFAERHGIAILGITHFNKDSEKKDIIERFNGSLALTAQARILLGTAADAQGDARRFVRVTGNFSKKGGTAGFEYTVKTAWVTEGGKDIETSRIHWGAQLQGEPAELLSALAEKSTRAKGQDFIRDQLIQYGGTIPRKKLKEAAEGSQHSWRTVNRVISDMREKGEIIGYESGSGYVYSSTDHAPPGMRDGGVMST